MCILTCVMLNVLFFFTCVIFDVVCKKMVVVFLGGAMNRCLEGGNALPFLGDIVAESESWQADHSSLSSESASEGLSEFRRSSSSTSGCQVPAVGSGLPSYVLATADGSTRVLDVLAIDAPLMWSAVSSRPAHHADVDGLAGPFSIRRASCSSLGPHATSDSTRSERRCLRDFGIPVAPRDVSPASSRNHGECVSLDSEVNAYSPKGGSMTYTPLNPVLAEPSAELEGVPAQDEFISIDMNCCQACRSIYELARLEARDLARTNARVRFDPSFGAIENPKWLVPRDEDEESEDETGWRSFELNELSTLGTRHLPHVPDSPPWPSRSSTETFQTHSSPEFHPPVVLSIHSDENELCSCDACCSYSLCCCLCFDPIRLVFNMI